MNRNNSFALLLCLAFAASAPASVTYSYQGNNYTTFFGATCTSSCSVSGFFSVATALAPNLVDTNVSPTSFSFTDSAVTITNSSSGLVINSFRVSTDSQGDIISAWGIDLRTATYQIFTHAGAQSPPALFAAVDGSYPVPYTGNQAYVSDSPGTWTTSTPEPGTAAFSVLAMAALGILRKWR
ncbi:MAG: hypothetical protein U0R19_03220 [Bryobacteraceae bacterium]